MSIKKDAYTGETTKNRTVVPLIDGYSIVAEQNPDKSFSHELFVDIVGPDGACVQEIAVIQPDYEIIDDEQHVIKPINIKILAKSHDTDEFVPVKEYEIETSKPVCVVESNTLDGNITVHKCRGPKEAMRIFQTIRTQYLEDEGFDTEEAFRKAKEDNLVPCDELDEFSLNVSSYGDYTITVRIQEMI